MNKRITYLALILILCSAGAAGAQNYEQQREELARKQAEARAEIEQLNDQIIRYRERLDLADQKLDSSYVRYENLERLIALQDEKLRQMTAEQQHIEEEIEVTERDMSDRKEEYDLLVDNYKNTLRYIYKNGRTTELALLFSSNSWNQMLVRAYYLEKFETHREEQAEGIREARSELEETRENLTEARQRNEELMAGIRREKEELNESYRLQEQIVESLQRNIEQIRTDIETLEEEVTRNNSMITELDRQDEQLQEQIRLEEEERLQNLADAENIENPGEREREVARYSTPAANLLDEETVRAIENAFVENKGSLPWPVESTVVATPFGRKKHPVYGTTTPSLGIEIITRPAEAVRVVQDGRVFNRSLFPGIGDVVLVKHGRFITAYGNLSRVVVRENAILRAGDIIGYAGVEESTLGESVFFMLRENNTNLDPEQWLKKN